MRKKNLAKVWGSLLLSTLCLINFSSCKEEDEEFGKGSSAEEIEYKCVILNQGNYSEANGSISIMNEKGEVTNHIYEDANGYPLASIIESGIVDNGRLILICNNEDKIEVVNKSNFKTISTIKGIVTPRYGVVLSNYLFVTSVPDWSKQEGYLYKVDLSAAKIDTCLKLDGQPEGIIAQNGKIVVGEGSVVKVINPTTLSVDKSVKGPAFYSVKHFAKDKDNNVWVSYVGYDEAWNATGGISQLNFQKDSIDNYTQLDNFAAEGHLNMNTKKTAILYRTVTGAYTENEVCTISSFNITDQSVKEVAKGTGYYGFNLDPKNGDIYTANTNGWITNSTLLIYSAKGEEKSANQTVGVGACRFIFQ